ncbi:MAG: hypothetical protein JKY26_01585 [Pseudomonas sp.]|nr:hypothetical protein [Pseudomonas sp.]
MPNTKAIPFKWEQIDAEHQRAKVPGGWLVKAYENVEHFNLVEHRHNESGWDWRIAMAFVPDANHQWRVESL